MTEKKVASATSRTAERIVDLLALLAQSEQPLTALEIASACTIPKSSTHQLLNYLATRQFVQYDPAQHTWDLGVALFELGSAYRRRRPLEELGRGILVEVSQETSATSHLAVRDRRDVLYIAKQQCAGTSTTQLVTETGVRLPAHLTAVGRALLATLDDAELSALYEGYAFPKRTSLGPASVNELFSEIQRVRKAGYAVESGLTTAGITCIAAAVRDMRNEPVAALGITFVTDQMTRDQVREHSATVRGSAERLSHDLGWRAPMEGRS